MTTVEPVHEPVNFQVPRRGTAGEDLGQATISSERLDDRVRYRLLKEAVVMHAANQRVGTHDTKTRGQIQGSNRKPWRQKGTGRARAGTRKSPLWRGGGTIFGPHPRDYSYSINKKQRRLALRSALYVKFRDGQVEVVEGLEFETPRTRELAKTLRALGLDDRRVLIATGEIESNLYLSARNLPRVSVRPLRDLNAYEVLEAETIVLTQDAFDRLASGETLPGSAAGTGAPSEEGAKER